MDNTKYVEMINPSNGNIVMLPCSPRHNGGDGALYYKNKGFVVKTEFEAQQKIEKKLQRLDEIESRKK